MTILNYPTDGLYPELIALARLVAHSKKVRRDDLIEWCGYGGAPARLSGAISRWTALGFFVDDDNHISLHPSSAPKQRESLESWSDRLPSVCRRLVLDSGNALPLFGDGVGISSDFAKGMAWLLAQDIFSLPNVWADGVELLEGAQLRAEKIVQNDTRWNGLRFWARYLGFATGGARSFMVDPTNAIREELPHMLSAGTVQPAGAFVADLSRRLPVLDDGEYRRIVEGRLDGSVWQKPASGHLSMSLSFALSRLEMDQVIALERLADAPDALTLTRRAYKSGRSFTHVRRERVAA